MRTILIINSSSIAGVKCVAYNWQPYSWHAHSQRCVTQFYFYLFFPTKRAYPRDGASAPESQGRQCSRKTVAIDDQCDHGRNYKNEGRKKC